MLVDDGVRHINPHVVDLPGFDALDDAKKAIEAGTMEASVAQFPYEMGKAAVESAVKVMNGEKLPADIMVKLEMVTKR